MTSTTHAEQLCVSLILTHFGSVTKINAHDSLRLFEGAFDRDVAIGGVLCLDVGLTTPCLLLLQ